jgi:hypothetical protein
MSRPLQNTSAVTTNDSSQQKSPVDRSKSVPDSSAVPGRNVNDGSNNVHQVGLGGLIGGFTAGVSGLMAALPRWPPLSSDTDQLAAAAAADGGKVITAAGVGREDCNTSASAGRRPGLREEYQSGPAFTGYSEKGRGKPTTGKPCPRKGMAGIGV